MDEHLSASLAREDYGEALARAEELQIDPGSSFVAQLKWFAAPEPIAELLEGINDHSWVAQAVIDRLNGDMLLEKALLEAGLQATEADAPQSGPLRRVLLQLQDRLRTYEEIYGEPKKVEDEETAAWDADLDLEDEPVASTSTRPPPSLIEFMRSPLVDLARGYAAAGETTALRILLLRLGEQLGADDRLLIANDIPLHTEALTFLDFVPSPKSPARNTPWRTQPDWSEIEETRNVAQIDETSLTKLFIRRIETVEAATGLVELALSVVQHGAARGIPGLEVLGEDLSLLSSLVYDRPESADGLARDDWNLSRWRAAPPEELVRAFLAFSTEKTIAEDILRLLRPYLFVLEARNEREGRPDPRLSLRLLYDYILSTSLPLAKTIFVASKPTMSQGKRIIKDDADLARLALACLYGSSSVEDWLIMNEIFETLPAFTAPADGNGATVALPGSPEMIFQALHEAPPATLTRLLDVLDVHLDSGETLAKWSAPQPLHWLVTTSGDAAAQRQWCLRLVRRGGAQAESEDEWVALLEDAIRLAAPDAAFNALSKDEVTRIFFEALLSAGSFSLAKSLLNPSSGQRPLEPSEAQELVLGTSRELYDNASSGNLHTGDMKLALECLSVVSPSPLIRKERDFIEATSRLCSFNLPNQPVPIQIRQATDKLALVNWVLEQHNDAYRHADMIIDLVNKLVGAKSPMNELRTLGMIVDAAIGKRETTFAADTCDRMVELLSRVKDSDAAEVVWRRCAAVGTSPDFGDLDRRMRLLGRAMLLAPESEVIGNLLPAWRIAEASPRGASSPPPALKDAARNAEAAARAAVSFGKAATAYLRPLNPQDPVVESGSPPAPASAFDRLGADHRFGVREAMSKRFTQGVGWLIGADASELVETDPVPGN